MSENGNKSGGVGLFGLLFVLFTGLKLCSVITWSWWWVTAPLWGGFAFVGALLVFALILEVIKSIYK
jgi:hypothetical protein